MRRRIISLLSLPLSLCMLWATACKKPAKPPTPADLCPAGTWTVSLDIGTKTPVRFVLDVSTKAKRATVRHGGERIVIKDVGYTPETRTLSLAMPHYDSTLTLTADPACTALVGTFDKQRKAGRETIAAKAARGRQALYPITPRDAPLTLSYAMVFEQSGPAVGRFVVDKRGVATGTILTPTGDYRFLEGGLSDEHGLAVSAFDFAHVFLFAATGDAQQSLTGTFASGKTWRESFVARFDANAALADNGLLPIIEGEDALITGSFVDLEGKPTDATLLAKGPRVIEVFGTWCPNCNDAVVDLAKLHHKYKTQGLEVIGLAFELVGDQARDLEQVRRYQKRHNVPYPLWLAGVADKQAASDRIPYVDRIRAWPTTIFIDRAGKVAAVHTGYAGPATGDEHKKQLALFADIIENKVLAPK